MTIQGGIVVKQDWDRDRDSVALGVRKWDIHWVIRPDNDSEFVEMPVMRPGGTVTLWEMGEHVEALFPPLQFNVGRWTRQGYGWEWRVATGRHVTGTVIATIRPRDED